MEFLKVGVVDGTLVQELLIVVRVLQVVAFGVALLFDLDCLGVFRPIFLVVFQDTLTLVISANCGPALLHHASRYCRVVCMSKLIVLICFFLDSSFIRLALPRYLLQNVRPISL